MLHALWQGASFRSSSKTTRGAGNPRHEKAYVIHKWCDREPVGPASHRKERRMAITLMTGTLSRTEPAREARGARRIPIGGALTIAIVAASALSGCSGGVSKRQITDAINEHLKGKACFSLQDLMPTTVSAEEQHVRDLEQQISAMMSQ